MARPSLAATPVAADGLQLTFDSTSNDLTSLSFQGQELLVKALPAVQFTPAHPNHPAVVIAEGDGDHRHVDRHSVTRDFGGLVVVTVMKQEHNTLRLVTTFRNPQDQSIQNVSLRPLTLQFPKRPLGPRWKWAYTVTTENLGEPGIVVADWGAAKLLACCDDVEHPVTFGFEGHFGNGVSNPVLIELDRLEPHEERTYRFSLRFGGADDDPLSLAQDIYEQFAKRYPDKLNWPDRRPIGELFLGRDNTHWGTNPRGWFSDEKLDVTTASGRRRFRERLLKYADNALAELQAMHAQGMIVWDPEGDQMPHATTYLGDPRVIPQAAPEMDAVADEFFGKFRAAGFKVGVCLRPSRVISDGTGGWKHRQVDDHVAEISDKIAYAKRRWGCTVFYLDTNVKWEIGMWQGKSWLLPTADLDKLTSLHPDVLIIPEFGRFGYWGCCMPYGELRGGSTHTSDAIRATYPHSGSAIAVGDGDYLRNWDELRQGVVAGDVHLFRGWFADPANPFVKRLYQEADYVRRNRADHVAVPPLTESLANRDSFIRWLAVGRVELGDQEADRLIIHRFSQENEWLVQKRMVEVLGESKNPAAVPLLAQLIRDRTRHLDRFAAEALAKLGRPAGPALVELTADKDPAVAEDALLALEEIDEPTALPVLLKLVDGSKLDLRPAAIRALGVQRSPKSLTKLVSSLSAKGKGVLIAACGALGRQRSRAAVKPLVELIERAVAELHDNDVRSAAGDALESITGLEYGPYERAWRAAFNAGKL